MMYRNPPQITAVDLFCGVGGLTHGLERAGVNVVLGVDIDSSCRHPIEANTSARFVEADISRITADELAQSFAGGGASLLAGCAPCQPFSTYSRAAKRVSGGSRRGRGGPDDWVLVRRFAELVREISPDLVTMENVPPLKDRDVFAELLDALDGYHVDHAVIDGRTIGLPQTRRRLVLVASRLGPIHLLRADLGTSTVRDAIEDLPAIAAGESAANDPLHAASRLSQTNLRRIRASRPGGTWRDWPKDLRAGCHVRSSGATFPSVYGRMKWDAPSPTITTQCFGYGNGRFGHPEQDRAISLREAAMLQGFPRNYSFLPDGQKPHFATLGRLIGNAVPVALGEYIGKNLVDHVDRIRALPA